MKISPPITWFCQICGQNRPDSAISVMKQDISTAYNLPSGTLEYRVRYCNDNPKCKKDSELFLENLLKIKEIHGKLLKVVKNLPSDFEPWGVRKRDGDDYGPDCSCGCKHFLA